MQDGGNSHGVSAAIFDDCYYLATKFIKIQLEHNYHEANGVAHELARIAKESSQNVWLDEPRASIITILVFDVTMIFDQ